MHRLTLYTKRQAMRDSRNSRVGRALTNLGWGRELGEGVKRMYLEIGNVFLDDPENIEKLGSIILTLKSNIVMRRIRREERISSLIFPKWDSLNDYEKKLLNTLIVKVPLQLHSSINIYNEVKILA
ncbi:hypothetical protein [Sporosarcina sp. G11-34]|uniref:hypothetical protein n=1 Tax=Sporosarcina sp. G11-34 TaxID=2849605 RepID=UPI0022A97E73|nr:hypothetical protein [Sporosarcina sp. G11-34]